MRKIAGEIAERTILLRGSIPLPGDLKLVTEEFREGWNFLRSGDARWLDRKIQKGGWTFIRIAEGSLRSGVGQTSHEAIAGGLKLALRRVSERFDAAEVGYIHLKQYPWFFLARVRVYPYLVRDNVVPYVSEVPVPLSMPPPPAQAVIAAANHAAPA